MRDPLDRRFGYPFIACTHCGPRYTIVTGLPYDRSSTTMVDFPMCAACQAEYDDPRSRRFHAQPTACPDCGPHLSMTIDEVVQALHLGQIVAIKGIGGYHLACDASNAASVQRLRERKHRGHKPFAVMVADQTTATTLARIDDAARAVLDSPARPIVLCPSIDATLQQVVAPGNTLIGIMLAYAPVHHLLFDAGAPPVLVMTSGNLADEPICITPEQANQRLATIADLFCHHDRRIHVACDDSVVRSIGTGIQPARRSRGYAPLPLSLAVPTAPVLAVGAELKTTVCVARNHHAWMSQHIGDTENLETLAMLERTASTLCELHGIVPQHVVSDMHPGYLSRAWAAQYAQRLGVRHVSVQHHHAHAASLMAEHQVTEPVLTFAFDGTGYGTDGTIWGGEILLATYAHAERIGHLKPVGLPGGDAAIRHVNRMALAQLHAIGHPWDQDLPPVLNSTPAELAVIGQMVRSGSGCTPTTSMGRLFDAFSSLLGVRHTADYEGQAAIELEALAASSSSGPAWPWEVSQDLTMDPAPALRAAIASLRAGMPASLAAWAFHQGLAQAVASAACLARAEHGITLVGLTGGVFANAVLTAACQERLSQQGFTVLIHQAVPPNDGGLALGQVVVAAALTP